MVSPYPFGFFISGPGIVGPYASPPGFPNGSINIATIEDNNGVVMPVTISSVNETVNAEYFVNNQTSSKKRLFNFFIDRYKEAYELELKELFLLAKKKKTPRSTFIDGYEALKLANAAVKSLSTKRTVFLSK